MGRKYEAFDTCDTNVVTFVVNWIPKFRSSEFIIPKFGKSTFLVGGELVATTQNGS